MYKRKVNVCGKEGGKVNLHFARQKACDCCSGMFCAINEFKTEVPDTLGVSVGDDVEIGVESRWILLLSCFLFFIPSVILITVLYLNKLNPVGGMGYSMLALVLYFLVFKISILKNFEKNISPKLLRKV